MSGHTTPKPFFSFSLWFFGLLPPPMTNGGDKKAVVSCLLLTYTESHIQMLQLFETFFSDRRMNPLFFHILFSFVITASIEKISGEKEEHYH